MKKVYYNIDGSKDRLTTFINNHAWGMPLLFFTTFTLASYIESLV